MHMKGYPTKSVSRNFVFISIKLKVPENVKDLKVNRLKDNVKNEREYNYRNFCYSLCLIRYNNCIVSIMGTVSKVTSNHIK